jgi:hypothetical protein
MNTTDEALHETNRTLSENRLHLNLISSKDVLLTGGPRIAAENWFTDTQTRKRPEPPQSIRRNNTINFYFPRRDTGVSVWDGQGPVLLYALKIPR